MNRRKHIRVCLSSKEYGNVFSDKTGSLYNLSTGLTLPSSTIDSLVSLESIGKEQYETFVRERLVERTVAIDSPIHSNKLQLMKNIKVAKSRSQELKDLKSLATTLCQLYVTNQVRGCDPTEFSNKSDLIQVLIDTSDKSTIIDLPEVDTIVIDVVHTISSKNTLTIDTYNT